FLDELGGLDGGPEARNAIDGFLDTYGMRCVGEIDITRPRWCERPATLVPLILGNVENAEPGQGRRRFRQGQARAQAKANEVLERLRAQPDGEGRAGEAARMIDRVRTFAGYREHPKYVIVSHHLAYKRALLAEADGLLRDRVIREVEDVHFLTFDELRAAVRT